eukprot:1537214-Rhodomonas_salina.1
MSEEFRSYYRGQLLTNIKPLHRLMLDNQAHLDIAKKSLAAIESLYETLKNTKEKGRMLHQHAAPLIKLFDRIISLLQKAIGDQEFEDTMD